VRSGDASPATGLPFTPTRASLVMPNLATAAAKSGMPCCPPVWGPSECPPSRTLKSSGPPPHCRVSRITIFKGNNPIGIDRGRISLGGLCHPAATYKADIVVVSLAVRAVNPLFVLSVKTYGSGTRQSVMPPVVSDSAYSSASDQTME
jgi:hypothetical protein